MEKMHPKLTLSIERMMLDGKVNLPFYGHFLLQTNFFERNDDPRLRTAGVNVTNKGCNYFYNRSFIDSLTQEQTNFLNIHEIFHLLLNHPKRTRMGGYDHELSNIAQDMIINTIIMSDIRPDFVDIPKDKSGRNTALFLPKDYPEEHVFEILYDWLKEKKDEFEKKREKKDDNKIFAELFTKANRPMPLEVKIGIANITLQSAAFLDTLTEKSKEEAVQYMRNFVRRVIVVLDQPTPSEIVLSGHTSSVVPDGETVDYNEVLSANRAQLFKMAVMDNLEQYMDTYAYCIAISGEEAGTLSQDDQLKFIVNYEEITSGASKKQRTDEMLKAEAKKQGTIMNTFKTYRMSELSKMDVPTLQGIVQSKGLTPPNVNSEKAKFLGLAEQFIVCEGREFKERIILNELDDEPAVLRAEIATLPQYKHLVNIKTREEKQGWNRRVEYKFPESMDECMGGGASPQSNNQGNRDNYGKNGKNDQECYGLDAIFDKSGENNGEFLDAHMPDEVPEELREQMVKDAVERMRHRGFVTGNIENTLDKLQKKRRDYLKEIKRGVSFVKGHIKESTIVKPNRRGIVGLKGRRKFGSKLNVILDVSGSMTGYFEKALSFVFRSDIEINLIQIDTEVKDVGVIKNMKELQAVPIRGGGGTTMKLAFDLVRKKYNNLNTLLLTDGYTEALDLAGLKGKVLIISVGQECPIEASNGKLKQICVDKND